MMSTILISEEDESHMGVDVIVFSYNRPAQLYAFLESFFLHTRGHNHLTVIYRADDERFLKSYHQVQEAFPSTIFCPQSSNPHQDFQMLTMKAAFDPQSEAKYVMFAVDDLVVTRPFDFRECTRALEAYDGYGFFLRLGTNITQCYMLSIPSPVPTNSVCEEKFLKWQFSDGVGDWGYPQNTDMTIYRKLDIQPMLSCFDFYSPNTMEDQWSYLPPSRPHGLCFMTSMMVNLPYNKVNNSGNKYDQKNELSSQDFLDLFEKGLKLDVEKYRNLENVSPHAEYEASFIQKKGA